MSGTQLKASLLLSLEDKLSSGLKKLQDQLAALRDMGKSLGLGALQDSLELLRGATSPIDALTNGLRAMAAQADITGAAIARMAAGGVDSIISVNSQGGAWADRSLGALAVSNGGGFGGGTGGGGSGGGGGWASLLLGRPDGASGIPLNFNPSRVIPAAMNLYGATKGLSSAVSNGIGAAFSAALEGAAVYEPIKMYSEFENQLRHIGIMEGKSGQLLDAEIKRLNALFTTDALKTGNSSVSIAEAYSDLIGSNFKSDVIDQVIRAHSEAATAYGISPEDMGHAVGAIIGNLKVPTSDIGGALAAMAYASQHGLYKITDFSRGLPEITGNMAALGMTGRENADEAFAAMEIVMKSAGDPSTGSANFHDLLSYLTTRREDSNWKRLGLDLPTLLADGEKNGVGPLDAFLNKVGTMIKGKSPLAQSEITSWLMTNANSRNALLALLQHKAQFDELRKTLDGITQVKLDVDYASAMKDPTKQLANSGEALLQIGRILGEGFLPTLTAVNYGLIYLLELVNWMNTSFPTMNHVVLGALGGLIAFSAVVTLIGAIATPFATGLNVLTKAVALLNAAWLANPITWIVLGIVAALGLLAWAAYEVYEHWGKTGNFFADLWTGVKGTFDAFMTWVDGWSGGMATRILHGIEADWPALVQGLEALLLGPSGLMLLDLMRLPQLAIPGTPAGTAAAVAASAGGSGTQVGGTIHVKVSGTPASVETSSVNPRVPLSVAAFNRGRVVGRQ